MPGRAGIPSGLAGAVATDPAREPRVRRRTFLLLALLAWISLLVPVHAEAGHEIPFYPSFYPQEIRFEALDRAAAAKGFQANTLHAYLGVDPFPATPPPGGVRALASLGGYVVATFNPRALAWRDPERRCEVARGWLASLVGRQAAYTFHPYPVTPYHPDYLEHFDRIEAAKARFGAGTAVTGPRLSVRARGPLARTLVDAKAAGASGDADVTIEDIALADLVAPRRASLAGWLGPPWLKAGWFHAYLLERDTMSDARALREVDALYDRLVTGDYPSETERVRLERQLVAGLGRGCERVVVGYTTRREAYNADFSGGIENVAHDSQTGLDAAIFVRTAKLKDFPWNGWLHVGTPGRPQSAWNPVAGFTDPASGLLWAAVGDPALFPAPGSGDWIGNRVAVESITGGSPAVPADAVLPEAGTGTLQPVGSGQTADVRIRYRVLASAFHDGSRVSLADLLYPFVFAYRWGAPGGPGRREHDPAVETSTRVLRDRLAGLAFVRADTQIRDFGDVKFTYAVQVLDVYLRHASPGQPGIATIAPPWSSVPWPVMVLMEEAVGRGAAAFSRVEATRRRVPWLDLARDKGTKDRLAGLLDAHERQAYVPPVLAGLVNAAQARARWSALREFYREHGHFLVTAGPYRLERWSPGGAVVGVFRDLTYPLGVGTYDAYAIPRRAWVTGVEERGAQLLVSADIEQVETVMRDYRLVREPLRDRPGGIDPADVPRCRYVVVGSDGEVARVGSAPFVDPAVFAVPLADLASPGSYTIAIALSLGDNYLDPEVKLVHYRAP